MKSWVLHYIGDIRFEDVPKPSLQPGYVIVKVMAAGICGSDIPRIYENGAHKMPLILGHEFAGQVVETNPEDSRLNGKRVGVFPLIPCKSCGPCKEKHYEMCRSYNYLGSRCDGGYGEYVAVPVWNLIELPDTVSYEAAAMLEPMAVAVHAMRRLELDSGDRILVYGAGTIGLFLVMFLLERGFQNVYVVGNKVTQLGTLMRMGLPTKNYFDSRDEALDSKLFELNINKAYECIGKSETIEKAVEILAPSGKLCVVGNPHSDVNLSQAVYWKILRNQLTVTGTWNSSFYGEDDNEATKDDWHYVIEKIKSQSVNPERMITHKFSMQDLNIGFKVMKYKSENYIKVMMICD